MFSSITNVIAAARDRATEAAAAAWLRHKIQDFAELKALEIDTRQKRILLEVELKGEVSPVRLVINAYEVEKRETETYVRITRMEASREWLGIALNKYVVGQSFKVPAAVGAVLNASA